MLPWTQDPASGLAGHARAATVQGVLCPQGWSMSGAEAKAGGHHAAVIYSIIQMTNTLFLHAQKGNTATHVPYFQCNAT